MARRLALWANDDVPVFAKGIDLSTGREAKPVYVLLSSWSEVLFASTRAGHGVVYPAPLTARRLMGGRATSPRGLLSRMLRTATDSRKCCSLARLS
jgi:hypothetical protein